MEASFSTYWPTVGRELLVQKTTLVPRDRILARASAAPGTAWSPR
jgi:hypothetical protein